MRDYMLNPKPVNWLERFPGRCHFYPGRDCPGWEPGGICTRIFKQIPLDAEPDASDP